MIKEPVFLENQNEVIPQTEINEFLEQHLKLSSTMQDHLEKCFSLGEKLFEWKRRITEAEEDWDDWVHTHLPIKVRTAWNYLDIYQNRELIRKELTDRNVIELPSQRFLLGITRKARKKKRTITMKEYCPTCGQGLTKKAELWMKQHSAKR